MMYIFSYKGEMPSYIIEFIPFVDRLEGSGTCVDRETGHTVNIYGKSVSENLKRKVYLSSEFRRVCPRNAYFLEERKEIYPTIKVFPLSKCPIYKKLKSIGKK